MSSPNRISYVFVVGLLGVVAAMHMTVPLITVLFASFALNQLSFGRKWLGLVLFGVVMVGIVSGLFLWLGFVITTLAVNNAYAQRKLALTVIDGLHWLGVLVVQGAVIGLMGVG